MDILIFEDDELQILIDVIKNLQILYHPIYAPNGKIDDDDLHKLEKSEVMIILDSNLLSPIYDIAKNGEAKDRDGLLKVSALILFSRFLRAQITSGFALIENEMNNKKTLSSLEKNEYFLYAVNDIPSMVWKKIAFGEIDKIPEISLSYNPEQENAFKIERNLHYVMHKIAVLKIVYFLRQNDMDPFDKFMNFMEWYVKNLILTESLMVYAAMVFADINGIKKPKHHNSKDFGKVLEGIENQAWDFHYLSQWSTLFNSKDKIFFFATNDDTLKNIIINSIPFGEGIKAVLSIFHTHKNHEIFKEFYRHNLGKNRVKPFELSDNDLVDFLEKKFSIEKREFEEYLNEK